jgi:hypothetical protein
LKGGYREGAGRKPGSPNKNPAKTKRLYDRLTDTEYSQVKEFIKQLREEKKNEA